MSASASDDTITIPAWANGPDDSGNGGWTAGLLAERLGDDAVRAGVVVNLRVPPPVGRPLDVVRPDGDGVELHDDGVLVASAHVDAEAAMFDVPAAVRDLRTDAAAAASTGFPFRTRHPFPHCVCCGIDRAPGQVALGLHCGPVPGTQVEGGSPVFADDWWPRADVADPELPSFASLATTWSALDCPSAAPVADPDATNPIVLARLAARVTLRPRIDELHVLAAWHVSTDGRKHVTRSAMLDATGTVLATAQALWIEVRPR